MVQTPAGRGCVAGRLVRIVHPGNWPERINWKASPVVLLAISPEQVQPLTWIDRHPTR